jgi:hypothetical protein
MVPADLMMLEDASLGLPDLADTEMALLGAPGMDPPTERLREYVVRHLEHR